MRILLTALLGIALLAACGGADSSPAPTPTSVATTPTTPSVSTPAPIKTEDVTVTPTPAAPSIATETAEAGNDSGSNYPVYEASTRTGIPSADRLIAAVVNGDLDAVTALVQYLRLPCVGIEKSAASGVVRCQPSEADGTIVSVFPVAFADRAYLRPDDARAALRQLIKAGVRVFAVYSVPATEQGNPDWPAGTVGIVFGAGGRGILARINDNGLVLLNLGAEANRNPYDLTNLYRDFILPPRK